MNKTLLDKAYQYCMKKGYRFTDPRQRVLKILVEAKKPLGAYDILKKLSQEVESPKPPTVYRAIQFWHQEGFIHCIDSLKSYVACSGGYHIGQTLFLICTQCDFVQELENTINFSSAAQAAESIEFSIRDYTVEIRGLCINCNLG